MDRRKGMAFCGLACCLCWKTDCGGCRNGGCADKDWCKAYRCGREKGRGCWACPDNPCGNPLLQKPKVRAFLAALAAYGPEHVMDLLQRNEQAGVVYHLPGQFVGDYDARTEREALALLLDGKPARSHP